MYFRDKLQAAWAQSGSQLVVGLDPIMDRLPAAHRHNADGLLAFCRDIVAATAPYVCAFTPQIAYFAAQRAEAQLERLCHYIRTTYPPIVLILSATRGATGTTARPNSSA